MTDQNQNHNGNGRGRIAGQKSVPYEVLFRTLYATDSIAETGMAVPELEALEERVVVRPGHTGFVHVAPALLVPGVALHQESPRDRIRFELVDRMRQEDRRPGETGIEKVEQLPHGEGVAVEARRVVDRGVVGPEGWGSGP